MENEIKQEELFIPKTKHKGLKIFLAIILIGALAAGGYFLYKEKFSNPNKTVVSVIEDIEKQVKNDLNDEKVYKFNGLLKIDANLSNDMKAVADIVNNLDLQFILEADVKNKLYNGTLNAKYKKEQLMDINLYSEENTAYILLQDIYDKYLKLSMDDVSSETIEISKIDINEEDIKTLTNSMMKAFKTSVSNLEFKRTDATIKIDDKDRNVYNNYVELKDAEMKKFTKDIVNTLANDAEFIKVFKKLVGDDANFNDLTKSIDEASFPGTYTLNIYTSKSLFNQKLVSIRFDVVEDDAKSSINYDKISDDEVLLSMDTSGGTVTIRTKKTNSVFNVNLSVNILGMKVKLDLSSNYEKIKEVTKPNVSDSKKIDDLTYEELDAIEKKIQENKGMAKLMEDTAQFMPAP